MRDNGRKVGPAAADDALALLGVPMSATLVVFGRLMVDEHERRVSKALAAAESLTGLTREAIADWVTDTPEAVPLLVRVLQAAGNNGNDRTLEMLGEALGRAHEHPQQRAREELIALAIDGLTQEHLDVLAACGTDAIPTAEVVKLLDGRVSATVVPMALNQMVPRGLFVGPYGRYGGGEYWELSELGVAVRDAATVAYPRRVSDG